MFPLGSLVLGFTYTKDIDINFNTWEYLSVLEFLPFDKRDFLTLLYTKLLKNFSPAPFL